MVFSRQEYWSGLPFPSPEDLSDPGIELRSPALQADSLLSATREAHRMGLLPSTSTIHRTAVQLDNIRINFFFFLFDWQILPQVYLSNSTGGHQSPADSSPRVTPVLLSSHWQMRACTLEDLWVPGHLWEPEPELELEWKLNLKLWPWPWFSFGLEFWLAEPETLGDAGMSRFSVLRVSSVGKST